MRILECALCGEPRKEESCLKEWIIRKVIINGKITSCYSICPRCANRLKTALITSDERQGLKSGNYLSD
ncbi:MAG: hypothetical protein CRN43_17770 [Candidatus Nephrothrix sp. EaCA]|nr:MAG: hypothetical protein CRN43_17770 [Candidatus Nephrothrix sp. EaCA]